MAICTLSDTDLPVEIKAKDMLEKVAIVGPLATENLGIEHLMRNVVSNAGINYLILCGRDSRGHQAGQAILALKDKGVDANNRIIGAKGPRPVIKNVTDEEIKAFRERVNVIDEIGTTDLSRLIEVVNTCINEQKDLITILPLKIEIPKVKVIEAEHKSNREWVQDAEGYFVVLLNSSEKLIVCEHYTSEGILNEVIKGAEAEDIANTAIKRSLISRLDHAAYLGRELAKAETALRLGLQYTQDMFLDKV